MSRLLVLDFDGTMTDAEAEGLPFRLGYLEDISLICGAGLDEVLAQAKEAEAEVAADPSGHGWRYGGHIVAPAMVDPYLRMMPVARKVLDAYGVLTDPGVRDRVLDQILYRYNYPKTAIAFREGAGDVLRGLEGTATWVVTNSHTDAVQDKIRSLGVEVEGANDLEWLVQRVKGSARKYVLDDDFAAVPATMSLPGLARPVLLRRRLYHDALAALCAHTGCSWEELVVVGDIFELDLCLPLAMGARVGLLANPHTPRYEQAFLEAHPRGAVLRSVGEIPAFAGLSSS